MNSIKERRSGGDRRKDRFGRRGPWIIRVVGNWFVKDPNRFLWFMILSMLFCIYTLTDLAWNMTEAIVKWIQVSFL